MGNPTAHVVSLTTNGSGAATGYTPVVHGRIARIAYAKTDFADGVDFTIKTEDTGQKLWVDTNINASEAVHPVKAATLTDGSMSSLTEVPIFAANERIKIVVASGGDTKTGSFKIIIV